MLKAVTVIGALLALFSTPLLSLARAQDSRAGKPVSASTDADRGPKTGAPARGAGLGSDDDHILTSGDLLDIKVFQEPDLDSTLRISTDGVVVVPLIDKVRVGGLTPNGAAKVIQDRLDKDYIVNPHVNVRVVEYAKRRFTVLGQVQKPGTYDMPDRQSISVLDAIGMASGYTRTANQSSIIVKRNVSGKETVLKLDAKKMAGDSKTAHSFEVREGDVIVVSESIF